VLKVSPINALRKLYYLFLEFSYTILKEAVIGRSTSVNELGQPENHKEGNE